MNAGHTKARISDIATPRCMIVSDVFSHRLNPFPNCPYYYHLANHLMEQFAEYPQDQFAYTHTTQPGAPEAVDIIQIIRLLLPAGACDMHLDRFLSPRMHWALTECAKRLMREYDTVQTYFPSEVQIMVWYHMRLFVPLSRACSLPCSVDPVLRYRWAIRSLNFKLYFWPA